MKKAMVKTVTIRRAKLQSNHHHQQTNTQLFYRPDALPVGQPTLSKNWREKDSHFMDFLARSLTWDLPALSLTVKGSQLACGEGCQTARQAVLLLLLLLLHSEPKKLYHFYLRDIFGFCCPSFIIFQQSNQKWKSAQRDANTARWL